MGNFGYMNLSQNSFYPEEIKNVRSDEEISDYYFQTLDEINKFIPSSGFDFVFGNGASKANNNDNGQTRLEIKSIFDDAKRSQIKTLKAKIEAILFLSDKPRGADSIAEQAEADADLVRQCLSQLVQEYEAKEGGIVIDTSDGYCMQISDQFEDLTDNILPIELRTAVLRTLSTIALKEPMLQSDLVKIRGGGIYEHVKELIEMGLVKRTKDGHSHILHTSKYFTENFKLSQNGIELQTILKKSAPTEVEFIRPSSLAQEDEANIEIAELNAN
jgi:segregation and condensation protein B